LSLILHCSIVPPDSHSFPTRRSSDLFLVGYRDEVPVACGGWRSHDEDDGSLRAGDAEIKRMFVVDGERGKGYARTMLAALERTRSEEHTLNSSHVKISYAVFCLKKKI